MRVRGGGGGSLCGLLNVVSMQSDMRKNVNASESLCYKGVEKLCQPKCPAGPGLCQYLREDRVLNELLSFCQTKVYFKATDNISILTAMVTTVWYCTFNTLKL